MDMKPPPPPSPGGLPPITPGVPGAPPKPAIDYAKVARGPEDPTLKERVAGAIKTVYDPEIPVNIYEMGMIYEIRADQEGEVYVRMTLTSPACPVAGSLPGEVETKVRGVEGVKDAKIELVWEPPWEMSMISEAARLQLNL